MNRTPPQLASIKNLAAKHPEAFTERYLRYLHQGSKPRRAVINGEEKQIEGNGFAPAFWVIGRKVFVREDKLFEIMEQKQRERFGHAAQRR